MKPETEQPKRPCCTCYDYARDACPHCTSYCDHCSESAQIADMWHFQQLPFDTECAPAGVSGSVCVTCFAKITGLGGAK